MSPAITEDEWLWLCMTATVTQDPVQRRLLEMLARMVDRKLPCFPGAQRPQQKA